MSKSDVFHLGLTKNDLQGATLAIVPGDPDRVEKIAALMDKPVKLASHREFTTWRAELDGKPVIVCSTGIGGPSTSIAVEELAQLGIRTFLRIGTTGAIQPHINVGDVLSRRPPTIRHTFGWLRLTTLAAFVNAIALVVITILIVWEAIERFRTQGQRFCLSKSGSYRQIPEFTVRTQKITDMGQRNGTGQTSRIYCQHRR